MQAYFFEVSFGKFQNGFLEQVARLGKRLIKRKFWGNLCILENMSEHVVRYCEDKCVRCSSDFLARYLRHSLRMLSIPKAFLTSKTLFIFVRHRILHFQRGCLHTASSRTWTPGSTHHSCLPSHRNWAGKTRQWNKRGQRVRGLRVNKWRHCSLIVVRPCLQLRPSFSLRFTRTDWSSFFRNVGKYLPDYTTSQPERVLIVIFLEVTWHYNQRRTCYSSARDKETRVVSGQI
jgi:hypothetical protein